MQFELKPRAKPCRESAQKSLTNNKMQNFPTTYDFSVNNNQFSSRFFQLKMQIDHTVDTLLGCHERRDLDLHSFIRHRFVVSFFMKSLDHHPVMITVIPHRVEMKLWFAFVVGLVAVLAQEKCPGGTTLRFCNINIFIEF